MCGNMNYLIPKEGTAARAMYFYVKHSSRYVSFDDLVLFGFNCQSLFKLPKGETKVSFPMVFEQINDFRKTVGVGEIVTREYDRNEGKMVNKKNYYIPPLTIEERITLKEQLDYFDSMPELIN
jgi:hypothetical protein